MRIIFPLLLGMLIFQPGITLATENSDYLNYIYFNSQMDHLRATQDRYLMMNMGLNKMISGGIFNTTYSFPFFMGVILEERYSDNSLALAAGVSIVSEQFGGYFMLFTSDWEWTFSMQEPEKYRGGFGASAFGLFFNLLPFIAVSADISFTLGGVFQYYRLYIPFLSSGFGVGISPYDSQISIISNTVVERSYFSAGTPTVNILRFESSLLKYVGLGLEYLKAKKTVSPLFTFAWHDLLNPLIWDKIWFDSYVYLKPDIEFDMETINVFGVDIRVKFYYYFPEDDVMGYSDTGMSTKKLVQVIRWGAFIAFSYKSPQNGQPSIAGESGWGVELGVGMINLENIDFLFFKNEALTLSIFYNYSAVFDTYPVGVWGIRAHEKF